MIHETIVLEDRKIEELGQNQQMQVLTMNNSRWVHVANLSSGQCQFPCLAQWDGYMGCYTISSGLPK